MKDTRTHQPTATLLYPLQRCWEGITTKRGMLDLDLGGFRARPLKPPPAGRSGPSPFYLEFSASVKPFTSAPPPETPTYRQKWSLSFLFGTFCLSEALHQCPPPPPPPCNGGSGYDAGSQRNSYHSYFNVDRLHVRVLIFIQCAKEVFV